MSLPASAAKFDPARAHEYAEQSRIALAGYDACHELSACMLAAAIGAADARILVAGAGGTGRDICVTGALEPGWQFTAVDPSAPMLALARAGVEAAGCGARTQFVEAGVDALPDAPAFDGATLIGVLHHVPGDAAKAALLDAIARRLKPGAPLVIAGNHRHYADHPRLLDAWQQRWRMAGATPDAVRAQLAKILQGADPPASEEAVFALLHDAGFDAPLRFFSSLFWGAWIALRRAA
ncbi:class I SAM-dependent methyltransferase [Burkholderia vietnamiensis]|uniref:class I SAM-dependent methyltransferase n=1 Tax=Burkholderia vietnamiensis TaxID=60552 RepID=UPI00075C62C4|nr:class I SAM-dependent methyltransferase [Burkholderia vietnamiensis]KVE02285.1 SAM-dependent methyltransferase [Burkholderia vietnamiensis]KVF64490.1 SAM-dependent methyltransferase [Burkholderia vietnamiensis]